MELIPARHVPECLDDPLRHLNDNELHGVRNAVWHTYRSTEATDFGQIVRRHAACQGITVPNSVLNEVPAANHESCEEPDSKKRCSALPSRSHARKPYEGEGDGQRRQLGQHQETEYRTERSDAPPIWFQRIANCEIHENCSQKVDQVVVRDERPQ